MSLPSALRTVTLMACASLLLGCGDSLDRADLVYINGVEPETIDPAMATGQPEIRVSSSLFEGLYRYNKAGQAIPGVAIGDPQISEDGRTYTFQLRDTAHWSNGDPVVAGDFLRAWKRVLTPETASQYVNQLFYIQNAEGFHKGKITDFDEVGVKAPADHELVVTLKHPTPFFQNLCAFITLAPVHLASLEAAGRHWTKPGNLVSNGPYQLSAWRINHKIRLEKNPFYWDRDNVKMESVDILPIGDPNTVFNLFYSGEVDLMTDKGRIPSSIADEVRKQPYYHSGDFLGTYFIRFNVTEPPFDDVRVRKAFSLVIDRDRIVREITRLGENPAQSLTPPGTGNGYEPPPGLGTDIPQAQKLMAEAGYPGGRGFPTMNYLYVSRGSEGNIAVELQNMWKKALGVEIALQTQEWRVYLNSMNKLNYDLCRSSWVGDYNDPNTFLDIFVSGSGNNRTGWSDAKYDGLIEEAAVELDESARYRIFQKAETLLIRESAVMIPLYYYVGVQLYREDQLGGVQANLLDEHPFREMYWKQ